MKHITIILAAALLTACGGGRTDEQTHGRADELPDLMEWDTIEPARTPHHYHDVDYDFEPQEGYLEEMGHTSAAQVNEADYHERLQSDYSGDWENEDPDFEGDPGDWDYYDGDYYDPEEL